jgi:hypothetical protein
VKKRTAAILILAAFGLGMVVPAGAQSAWDGAFVAPPVGGVWLISGTQKWQIQVQDIAQDEFDRYENGGVLTGAWQVASAVAPPVAAAPPAEPTAVPPPPTATPRPAPQPTTRPAPPPPSNPAATLVGQSGQGCSGSTTFAVRVEKAEWVKTVGGVTADGMWAVLTVNATNTGTKPDALYLSWMLRDDRSRTYQMVSSSEMSTSTQRAIGQQNGLKGWVDTLQPGVASRVLIIFQAAPDAQAFEIIPNPLYCR